MKTKEQAWEEYFEKSMGSKIGLMEIDSKFSAGYDAALSELRNLPENRQHIKFLTNNLESKDLSLIASLLPSLKKSENRLDYYNEDPTLDPEMGAKLLEAKRTNIKINALNCKIKWAIKMAEYFEITSEAPIEPKYFIYPRIYIRLWKKDGTLAHPADTRIRILYPKPDRKVEWTCVDGGAGRTWVTVDDSILKNLKMDPLKFMRHKDERGGFKSVFMGEIK